MPNDWLKRYANLKNLTFVLSLTLFVWVIWYCYTGSGGGQELVSRLLPIALILQILLTYQNEDEASMERITEQKEEMTDDACLYSKTCPWRGEPPAENCIADPEVPCVLGE